MRAVRHPCEWVGNVQDALARLADRPWMLFVILLAVNTITQPYAGITHDSRLYSGQVLNRVEAGAYADDLFFRYGSQDDYSLFSHIAGPLVRLLGLQTAFFLIYLFSKTLLVWGMMRLTLTLIPNRAAGVVALIYGMAITIHYGGHRILNVQETFVTPRMLACALTLIGLDLILRRRPVASLLAITAGLAVHPLMAFGGLLLWAGFHVWQYLGGKVFGGAVAVAALLALGVLANPTLALRMFGEMDLTWRQSILETSPFNFPSEWSNDDWCYLAAQLLILGLAIVQIRLIDPVRARFLAVLFVVTLAGTIGASLGGQFPYALLLQGQAYRALWLLAVLHIGLAVWLSVEWSADPRLAVQLASCALLAYLCWTDRLMTEWLLPVLVLPIVALILRGLESEPRDSAWVVRSIQVSLLVGGLLWTGFKLMLLASRGQDLLVKYVEYRDIAGVVLANLGPLIFVAGLCWLLRRHALRPRMACFIAGVCLAVHSFAFAFPLTDYYAVHCSRYRSDLRVIRETLDRDRDASDPLPTVYCNLDCLDYVWIDLHAKCYFDPWQAGNFMFCRAMAMEGQRRAHVVGPFELAHYRHIKHVDDNAERVIAWRMHFHRTDVNRAPLDADELAALCREPGLDYVLLDQRFDGYIAQAGELYLYRCGIDAK